MTNKISVRSVSVAAPIKIPCNARCDTFQVSETYLIDAKLVSTGVIAWHADAGVLSQQSLSVIQTEPNIPE